MYVCAGRKNVNFFRTQSLSRNLEARILTAICHPFRFLMVASESSVSRCCCCCSVGHQQRKTARHKQKQQKTVRLGQSGRERETEGAERGCLVGGWGFRLALTVLVVVVSCLRGGYSFAMLLLLLGGSWLTLHIRNMAEKRSKQKRGRVREKKLHCSSCLGGVCVCICVCVCQAAAQGLPLYCTYTHTHRHAQTATDISDIARQDTHTHTTAYAHF